MTAIEKMVEWLEAKKELGHIELSVENMLVKARRLALEEATEKPTELCQTCGDEAPCLCEKPTHIRIDEPHPLPELGTIKPLMRPTAPASLVEELEKLETVEVDDEIGRTYYYYMQQVDSILSRYRPSTQADIVGELKGIVSAFRWKEEHNGYEQGQNAVCDAIEEIIAKFEGAK